MSGQKPRVPDAEFIALFEQHGGAQLAKLLGIAERNIRARRRRLEERIGREIKGPEHPNQKRFASEYPTRHPLRVQDGVVLVGSDAHYWPGEVTAAHRALVHLSAVLKPKAVILNGDVLDGATISRHPPIGWDNPPTLIEEIQAVDERLDEIRKAARGAELLWTLGNHCARFESKLALQAPQYAKVHGTRLSDHFPHWRHVWSVWINDSVVVKHRFRSGLHATMNNALWAGKTMVTGHLHSLRVTPLTDYTGTRFGVDTGTLADPDGEQFAYTEDNPKNWRSGFVVLTFRGGFLLWPEVVAVLDEKHVQFRGEVIAV